MGKIIYGNEVAKTVKDDLKKRLGSIKKKKGSVCLSWLLCWLEIMLPVFLM